MGAAGFDLLFKTLDTLFHARQRVTRVFPVVIDVGPQDRDE